MLTDVSLYTNNTSDEHILKERIAGIKQRTGVKEMVTDGNFSGEESEGACAEQGVKVIFTGIKGAKFNSECLGLHDFHLNKRGIKSCPQGYKPISEDYNPATRRWVVHFDKERCSSCPLRERCCVQKRKKFTTLYFTEQRLRVARRRQQFTKQEYQVKQKLRPVAAVVDKLFCFPLNFLGKILSKAQLVITNTIQSAKLTPCAPKSFTLQYNPYFLQENY